MPFVLRWPGQVAVGTSDALVGQIDLFASPATPLGGLTVVLPSLAWHQLNNVFHFLAPEVEDGFALVRTTTPSGRFFAWASVVDNASSDSVLVPGW